MHKLNFTNDAGKFLKKLPPKQYRQVVGKILGLMGDPAPNDSQQLRGYEQFRRVDIGEYRIVYRIEGDTVFVDTVGKRNDDDVYKRFKRKGD